MFSIAIALSLASIAIATTPSHVGSTCSTTGLLPVLPTGQFALTLADGQATKFVAVGRGTQNYTCESGFWTTTGALAYLWDTSCYPIPATRNALPDNVLQFPFNASSSTAYPADASLAPLGLLSYINYNNAGVPTAHFDFTRSQKSATEFSTAFESGNIASPDNSSKNITWQQLLSEDGDLATRIFVINTAGGASPSNCTVEGAHLQVDFAANYWFMQ